MRWLASLPRWLLAGLVVLLLPAVVFGWLRSVPVVASMPVEMLFFFVFALLMALVGRRGTPGPHSPH
jgi:hypothetical protein